MTRPAVLRQVESHVTNRRVTAFRLRASDAGKLVDYVRELEGRVKVRGNPSAGKTCVEGETPGILERLGGKGVSVGELIAAAPEGSDIVDADHYVAPSDEDRCTRCGATAMVARKDGCTRGPCPMVQAAYFDPRKTSFAAHDPLEV